MLTKRRKHFGWVTLIAEHGTLVANHGQFGFMVLYQTEREVCSL